MSNEDASSLLTLLWSPLVVVTAAAGGRRGGQIAVSAFAASIVPDHPRILIEIQKRNQTHELIAASGRFAVHLLLRERWEWSRHFGFRSQREVDKFDGIGWQTGPHDIPLLDDVLGILVCRVVNAMDGGDMTIYLADVEEARRLDPGQPLHWHEVQQMMPPDWFGEYGRKLAHDVPDSAQRMGQISLAAYQPPGSDRD